MSYTPPPPPPPGTGGYAAPQTNPKALWAMILGILGIVSCGVLAGIPALILGNSAQKEIAQSGGAQTGEGMAKAGVIMGWIAVALAVLGIVVIIILAATGALTSNG